jgi:nucleoside-diphosphate-sugar epimerase
MGSDLPSEIDVGTGIATTNWDLAKLVARHLGKESVLDFQPVQTNTHVQQGLVVGMNSPLHARGWRPMDTLETGLGWALGF